MMRSVRSRLQASVAMAAIGAQLALSIAPAGAFCGFYVAKADSKMFNKSSKVVLTRDGQQTAITMASDYEGEPNEFALVVPVPTFIERNQIRRRRARDGRSSRRLHGAAAGRVSRSGPVRAADGGRACPPRP